MGIVWVTFYSNLSAMKLPPSPRFDTERQTYALVFTCEHCVWFDDGSERCVQSYPCDEHRLAYYAQPGCIVFCKGFEVR